MTFSTPMTLIISVVLLACFIVGLSLLIRSLARKGGGRGDTPIQRGAEQRAECPDCHHANPLEAKFCARCGAELNA